MAAEFTIGDRLTEILARARGLADGPVGTGQLLFSVAYDKPAARVLDAFDISPQVVLAVLRTPGRARAAGEPDAGFVFDPDVDRTSGPFDSNPHARGTDDRAHPLSTTAATALQAAEHPRPTARHGAEHSRPTAMHAAEHPRPTALHAAEHIQPAATASRAARSQGAAPHRDTSLALLAALLEDPGSEAAAVIRDCGIDLAEIRQATRDGFAPQRPDRVAPELRPARDALIGRTRYRGRGLRDRLLFSVLARRTNHAERPVLWARLEADERAREQNRPTRTDDLLLAMLVTHEVAAAYPHLARAAQHNYGGGAALLAEGIDHRRVRATTLDSRPDEVPSANILRPGPDWTEDTSLLLGRLVAHSGNRSARLLATLGRARARVY
jgi:hypothetical protein